MIKKVDILITTFKRYGCLENLLKSIPEEWKDNIIIGDQNKERKNYPYRTIFLPYDCGLSYARNRLVDASEKPFVLLLEDDFEWTDKTQVKKLLRLMNAQLNVGVVGGQVRQNDVAIPFEFIPTIEDGVLYHKRDGNNWKVFEFTNYKKTGCIMNFALFRKSMLRDMRWDPQLKLREHQDFYLRLAKTKWQVLYTPDVRIKDAKVRHTPEYRELKNRDEFLVMMMKKHGITKIKYQNGACRLLVDGKIVKANEEPIAN